MRIGRRLSGGYAVVVLGIVIASLSCMHIFWCIDQERLAIKGQVIPNIEQTMHLYEALVDMDHWIATFLLQGDPESYARAETTFYRIQTLCQDHAQDLSWPDAQAAENLIAQFKRYSTTVVNLARLKQQGTDLQTIIQQQGLPYHAHMNDMLRALGQHRHNLVLEIHQVQKVLQTQEQRGWWTVIVTTGAVTLLAIGIGILVTRSITRPIAQLQTGVHTLGQGDLSTRIPNPGTDELGELGQAFNQMIESLQATTVSIDYLHEEIDERKRTEVALEQARTQADAANQAKSQFLANVSHEIRTPLNAILTMSRLLQQRDSENLTKQQKEGLDIVHWSSQQLLSLINSILDMAKIEAGQMETTYINTQLSSLLEGLQNLGISLIGDQPIQFDMKGTETVPETLITDPAKLQIILTNIIGNAVKFTEKGKVTLEVSHTDTQWTFQITDTGIGIPPEKLSTIFDEFTQADGSTTRRYAGTGLGLAIAKRMTELLGGTINVHSTPNQGTLFTVTLPNQTQETNTPSADSVATTTETNLPASTVKVLIAEDDEFGRAALRLMLTDRCQLSLAIDGQDAVCQATAQLPDVIFLDIMMPAMDGYQAYTEIRNQYHQVPIIALTAKAMADDRERLLAYGFTDYLSKPIDEDKLLALIAQYTHRSK